MTFKKLLTFILAVVISDVALADLNNRYIQNVSCHGDQVFSVNVTYVYMTVSENTRKKLSYAVVEFCKKGGKKNAVTKI